MGCLTSTRKTQIKARLTKWEARADAADDYYASLLTNEGIESGKFDSGESMSWWKNVSIEDFTKTVGIIDQWIDHYRNQLNGTGIVRLTLDRGR